jgi:hypothetical protein
MGLIKKEAIIEKIAKKEILIKVKMGIIIKAKKEAKKGRIVKKGITVIRMAIFCILV